LKNLFVIKKAGLAGAWLRYEFKSYLFRI